MLETTLCGIKLRNPTVLASGILGVTKETASRIGKTAGAVTLKSICHEERKGNPNPVMFAAKEQFFNAVGLPGQGIDNFSKDFARLDDVGVPIIASVFGYTIEQFGSVAAKMATLNPSMIELDISCPHMDYSMPFYADADSIRKITSLVKSKVGKIPVSVKLSPNVHNIAELALIAEKAGADAITAVNTATAMKIDIETGKPILSNKTGGLSGPALRPIAVRCVYEIYQKVKIPIIGTGGVTTGEDAIEMIMAGAAAVGVGSAFYYRGLDCLALITSEMEAWLKKRKLTLKDIRGKAHE